MFALVVSRIFLLDFTGLVQYFICIRYFFSILIFFVITNRLMDIAQVLG